MNSQKMPANVKFSTSGTKKPYEFITHNAEYSTIPPGGKGYGPMLRDYSVIRYCTRGHGTLVLNDKTYPVSPGQCYFIPAGSVAKESGSPNEEFSTAFVTFLGVKTLSYFSMLGITPQNPFLPWDECPEFLEAIHALTVSIGNDPYPDKEFDRCSKAYWLMQKLQDVLIKRAEPKKKSRNIQGQYMEDALLFMETNFTQKLTVSDIAAHIGINRSYFYTLFKQHTGISPQEHLTRLRIGKACDLFAYPHSTAVTVANALGFESSVFFRHFKRITGMTPSEYKQSIANGK